MSDDWLTRALAAASLLACCALIGVALGLRAELADLRRRLMRSWQREAGARRALEVERAGRAQDRAAYDRRVRRWCEYATQLQDVCISLGTLAPWKAAADRQAAPFVDSDAAPLSDEAPG